MFGGAQSPARFTRVALSYNNNIQTYNGEIYGIDGGYAISANFDGGKYIYLVGGSLYQKVLHRVDRFNIDTLKFNHVGTFHQSGIGFVGQCENKYAYYLNNKLYLVNQYVGTSAMEYRLLSFDVKTGARLVILEKFLRHTLTGCCFDGVDNIYFRMHEEFIRVSLSSKLETKLAPCPIRNGKLEYDSSFGIYSIYDNHNDYRYSIQDNKWTLILENNRLNDRTNSRYSGHCLILD
ncbi:hypothetical protein SAMD00019534_056520 [Acytostelium subglobosum LB1]|uniref:hypothetical protein n=1 Tax=Acytostelium subglobosum LB1 TaxID=1410327 RepID=UPI000644A24C|nr:hypothetical protein SAMD00019534_056520 [Acytostelium subglobosum LB1]GAM22477.1 hypothetical protein SAMD00019534_056520 [Acytostelium subglobosum LB1]|eukprot:XP_012754597.1 hypothetical protein SAMD00019534_056520 [Acytostelium subglobosum LB1]